MDFDHHFVLLLQKLINISIQVLDENGDIILLKNDVGKSGSVHYLTFLTNTLEIYESKPKIFQEDGVCFGGFFWNQKYFIIGPCTIGGLTFTEKYQVAKRYGIKGSVLEVPEISYQKMSDILALLYYQVTGEKIPSNEIWKKPILEEGKNSSGISESEQVNYGLKRLAGSGRTDYATERRYYECIRNGEKIALITDMDGDVDVLEKVGEMAQSGIKQFEYLAVATVTMSTRAAIEGGMDIEEAYKLSDLYLQHLEKCSTQNEMLSLCMQAMNDFSDHVAEVRKKREKSADYVEKCKVYICRHLREKIDMKELAEKIGLNCSYLSRNFSQYSGMSLTEYARKEKLKKAANMLRYTNYSIAEIAEYFCFSSSSRFSEFFKEEYGMIPSQYRKIYHVYDFSEMSKN